MEALTRSIRQQAESALCDPHIRESAQTVAADLGVGDSPQTARKLLTLIYLSIHPDALQSPSLEDVSLEEVAAGGEAPNTTEFDQGGEALSMAAREFTARPTKGRFAIAAALLRAWLDRTKEDAAKYVLDMSILARIRGEDPSPSLRNQARVLGVRIPSPTRSGAEAAAEIERTVRNAFWDSIKEKAESGDTDVLWNLAEEMRGLLLQLLYCAPQFKSQVEEHFDISFWRQQQHLDDFGQTLRQAILYVTDVISQMVAAVDRAETEAWAAETQCELDSATDPKLYFTGPFINWLRVCFVRLEKIAEQIAILSGDVPDPDQEQ